MVYNSALEYAILGGIKVLPFSILLRCCVLIRFSAVLMLDTSMNHSHHHDTVSWTRLHLVTGITLVAVLASLGQFMLVCYCRPRLTVSARSSSRSKIDLSRRQFLQLWFGSSLGLLGLDLLILMVPSTLASVCLGLVLVCHCLSFKAMDSASRLLRLPSDYHHDTTTNQRQYFGLLIAVLGGWLCLMFSWTLIQTLMLTSRPPSLVSSGIVDVDRVVDSIGSNQTSTQEGPSQRVVLVWWDGLPCDPALVEQQDSSCPTLNLNQTNWQVRAPDGLVCSYRPRPVSDDGAWLEFVEGRLPLWAGGGRVRQSQVHDRLTDRLCPPSSPACLQLGSSLTWASDDPIVWKKAFLRGWEEEGRPWLNSGRGSSTRVWVLRVRGQQGGGRCRLVRHLQLALPMIVDLTSQVRDVTLVLVSGTSLLRRLTPISTTDGLAQPALWWWWSSLSSTNDGWSRVGRLKKSHPLTTGRFLQDAIQGRSTPSVWTEIWSDLSVRPVSSTTCLFRRLVSLVSGQVDFDRPQECPWSWWEMVDDEQWAESVRNILVNGLTAILLVLLLDHCLDRWSGTSLTWFTWPGSHPTGVFSFWTRSQHQGQPRTCLDLSTLWWTCLLQAAWIHVAVSALCCLTLTITIVLMLSLASGESLARQTLALLVSIIDPRRQESWLLSWVTVPQQQRAWLLVIGVVQPMLLSWVVKMIQNWHHLQDHSEKTAWSRPVMLVSSLWVNSLLTLATMIALGPTTAGWSFVWPSYFLTTSSIVSTWSFGVCVLGVLASSQMFIDGLLFMAVACDRVWLHRTLMLHSIHFSHWKLHHQYTETSTHIIRRHRHRQCQKNDIPPSVLFNLWRKMS